MKKKERRDKLAIKQRADNKENRNKPQECRQ